jgi:hypothetical protein
MPSAAYDRWSDFVRDPDDLLARLRSALDVADPDPSALSRAVIVSLIAAWETYVEELAREAALLRVDEGSLPYVDGDRVGRAADALNNPRADDGHVTPLLSDALGADPWVGVAAGGHHGDDLRSFVNATVQLRHEIAHGRVKHSRHPDQLHRLIAVFGELVVSLDGRARAAVFDDIGRWPWPPAQ